MIRLRFMLIMNDCIGEILFDLRDSFESSRSLSQETPVKLKK